MKSLIFKKSNLQAHDVLTKNQMKRILGGDDGGYGCSGSCDFTWTDSKGVSHTTPGTCKTSGEDYLCYCSNGEGVCS